MFAGGRLTYTSQENTTTGKRTGSISGSVEIAGAYQGTVSYDIEKSYDEGDFSGLYHAFSESGLVTGDIPPEDYNDWEDRAQGSDAFNLVGRITDPDGNGVSDVTVVLSVIDRTTETDKDGNYYFGDVPSGTYAVFPALDGYTFHPITESVTVDGSDVRVDFIGSPAGESTVSGRIVDFSGNGIVDIQLKMTSSTREYTAVTGEQGYYEFVNILDDTYGVEPESYSYTFTPPLRTVIVSGNDITIDDFTGSSGGSEGEYSISGRFSEC